MGRAKQRVCDYLLDRYYNEDYDSYLIDYLPTHLIEGEMYEELTKVLVDFNFLIQKCKQGHVYELIRDYHAAFDVLPETREARQKEKEYMDKMLSYSNQLISFPEKIQSGEVSLDSLTPLSDRKIDAEIERIESGPSKGDELNIFLQFLDSRLTYYIDMANWMDTSFSKHIIMLEPGPLQLT